MRGLVTLSLIGVLWSASGCASSAPGHKLSWRTLSRGLTSGIEAPRQVVLRDEPSYLRLWAEHAAEAERMALPPTVDFDREMVIFVALGTRPTGGYLVEVVDIELRARRLRVLIGERTPQPGGFQIQQRTQPYHLIALPAMQVTVDFRAVRQAEASEMPRRARPGEEGAGAPPLRPPRSPVPSPRGASS